MNNGRSSVLTGALGAEVLIIFGSDSDSKVYDRIQANVPKSAAVVCSAHRSPDILDDIMGKSKAMVFVAGAGLAAHLPGVVASKTIRPVIGVPVDSNFSGMDSLLAIVQMPPGIPVLAVGPDNADEAAKYAKLMLREYHGVTIIGDIKNQKAKKAIEMLDQFGVSHEFADSPNLKNVNINFGNADEEKGLTINVPLIDTSTPEKSLELFHMMRKGLWVGVGRAENAAIAAVEILDYSGKYASKLKDYRDSLKRKIIEGLQ
ncbi:MAG: hypothetical protein QS98_C0003G0096 [archaeon GW2011_AR3]|nr:MAG: hypothetical protein QS98_C0003G0096 [archaeon GW2011_AR3]MBS3110138.1 AIR carboxylase family protein [Candidatus Woesearchaeota archaeon]